MQLHEESCPSHWGEVVGQDKVLTIIERLRERGLTGRAFWLIGGSGTGKTTIAKLLAAEVADDYCIEEVDAESLTPSRVAELEKRSHTRCIGNKPGWAIIVNEAHGLKNSTIRQLLVTLDNGRIPKHVVWIFTTTNDGAEGLFDDSIDAGPLTSRCTVLPLARRDLTKPFAQRLKQVAAKHNLDGKPLSAYERLLQNHKNNMRAAYQAIEAGSMLEQ